MPQRSDEARAPIPRWLIVVASLAILAHLFALGGRVLSEQSGPWVTPFGNSQATPPGEAVPPPHQQAPSVEIWEPGPDRVLRLRSVAERLVPRARSVLRASEWSKLLARAYGRYLCRVHGAASAQIFRHTKEALLSSVLLVDESPNPEELVAAFEEVKR